MIKGAINMLCGIVVLLITLIPRIIMRIMGKRVNILGWLDDKFPIG